ncbi:hypothetical protein BOX15_Mlig000805g3, partial [Macrostomum lignano]
LCLSLIFLWLLWRLTYARDRGSKPMPHLPEVPFLGHLPFLAVKHLRDPKRRQYMDMVTMQHHPVFSNIVGLQRFVIISGYEAIKSAFFDYGDAFSGRPRNPFYLLVSGGKGVILSEGSTWKEQRRFALRVLRDLGLGKSRMEEVISAEAEELVANFAALNGRPVNTKDLLSKAVANVIGGLVFSERSGYEDPDFKATIDHVTNVTQVGSPAQFLTIFYPFLCQPWIVKLLPGLNRSVISRDWLSEACQARVNRIRQKFNEEFGEDIVDNASAAEPVNFVEAYLREQRRRLAAGESTLGSFDDEQLVQTVLDLYIAGSDTTTSTLGWLLLYSALHPDEQRQCQAELATELSEAPVRLDDRRRLHRVLAFIDEGMRMSSILVHNVDRRVLRDTEFLGYLIPASAIVFINLYGHHRDPRYFPNPSEFKPSRFLDSDGRYQASQYLIPFGLGRRSCLGESLAKAEVFLLFASLLQKFNIELTDECLKLGEDLLVGTDGIVRAPEPHQLRLVPRD